MPGKTLIKGARFEICLWLDEEGSCHVEEFILELYGGDDPDAAAMYNLLERTAHHGPPPNEHKFRYLKGNGQGLVEFKSRGGARVLGFIDSDRHRIMCTHGLPKLKPKQFDRWVKRAQQAKELYLVENLPEDGDYVH
jgi:hypothetical protein